jgi:hypothetical protein
MRAIPILLAALAVASCDDYHSNKNNKPGVGFQPPFTPSPAIAVFIPPSPLPIVTIPTIGCSGFGAFTTAFDLVVTTGRNSLSLDSATFRLLDGTNVGGSPITIPQTELVSMFGSTKVVGSRAFPFRPQFGCGSRRPVSITGDIRLVDSSGAMSNVTVTAGF